VVEEAVATVVEAIQMGTIILTVINPAVRTTPAAIPTGMTTLGLRVFAVYPSLCA
jgi:hypothetical protein